ncbi:3237_t:CDS:2 [Rhizophagus irregularis]|nr:3237_t:CDS:2 [Rhizophagus irregularis]
MTSTLSVIALVIWLRSTAYTVNGNTLYREKISNQTHTFTFKQLVNAHHEYNEIAYHQDGLSNGSESGPNSEHLKWDLMQIPSIRLFVNISTSAEEPLTSYEDINFVKTRSLIYSPFHQTAHYINFEVGYSKDTKWFDSLNDKKSVNTFALKRNESASRSVSSTRTKFDDSNKKNSIVIDDDEPAFQSTTDNNELSKLEMQTKPNLEKKQDQSSRMTPSTAHLSPTPTYRSQKCKLSDLCNLEESNNDPDNDPNNFGNNPGNGNDPVNDPFRLECTYYRQESGKGGRGGRGGKGKRG